MMDKRKNYCPLDEDMEEYRDEDNEVWCGGERDGGL